MLENIGKLLVKYEFGKNSFDHYTDGYNILAFAIILIHCITHKQLHYITNH